jgi:hypothetical protein
MSTILPRVVGRTTVKRKVVGSYLISDDLSICTYRRNSISGTKKAQITFPLRHFFPLKVVPLIEVLLYLQSWA